MRSILYYYAGKELPFQLMLCDGSVHEGDTPVSPDGHRILIKHLCLRVYPDGTGPVVVHIERLMPLLDNQGRAEWDCPQCGYPVQLQLTGNNFIPADFKATRVRVLKIDK